MQKEKPIAFYPQLARELGGISEALFYQQLYFWSDKGDRDDGWVYKTTKQLQEETTLTREMQDRVRKKLIAMGWIEVKKMKAKGAPTLHYRCMVEVDLICVKPTNGNVGNPQMEMRETHKTSITENTTESTTDTSAGTSPAGSDPLKEKIKFTELGADILKSFEKINPACKKMYGNTTQRQACDDLCAEYGYDRVKTVVENALPKTNLIKYFPECRTPKQLWDKWTALETAIAKKRKEQADLKNKNKMAFG